MKRPAKFAALAAVLVLLLAAGLWALAFVVGDHEVTFAGRAASDWAIDATNADAGIRGRAVEVVDSVVIPGLVRQINTDTNDSAVLMFLAEQLGSLPGMTVNRTPNEGRRIVAVNELAVFGAHAKPAVPLLLDILRRDDPDLLGAAAQTLEKLGEDPAVVVPLLLERVADAQGNGRPDIVDVLGEYGPRAKAAVPRLVAMLADRSSKDIVSAVPKALKAIDPEAAARAGVR